MAILGLSLVIVVSLALAARAWRQRGIARASAIPGGHAVDELVRWPIGGVQQSVLLRGRDVRNPVLLYLHGGPGDTFLPFARTKHGGFEELFVVASWAQRGCLGSYRRGMSKDDMTVEQVLADAVEVIEHLRERFGAERVYAFGGSWGTLLGTYLAAQRPDLLHAYIGKAQMVSIPESDRYAIGWVLEQARERGDARVIERFERRRPPLRPIDLGRLSYRVARYGGYGKPTAGGPPIPGGAFGPFVSPDYSLVDLAHWLTNPLFGAVHLAARVPDLDFRAEVPRIEVPVFVLQGTTDVMTPIHLVEEWLGGLDAPAGKRLIPFEGVGHNPVGEAPEAAFAALREIRQEVAAAER